MTSPLLFPPLVQALLALALALALVPLVFAAARFWPLARAVRRAAGAELPTEAPALSIVVCAHNAAETLYRLVPALLTQEYPGELEFVLVDDRSQDATGELLQQLGQLFTPAVRLVTVRQTPAGLNPKKYALTLGLKVARHPYLLVTDADCVPDSPNWAARMATAFDQTPAPAVVLGFGGYAAAPTLLNLLIRYETLLTGALYLSAARAGRAYMGVGRNLAYTKTAFTTTRGFSSHIRSLGGDDDLFVQDAVRARLPISVVLHPDAQTTSAPPVTWGHWWRQKRRHLGAGTRYGLPDKLRAGTLPLSGPLFGALAGATFVLAPAAGPWLLAAWAVRLLGLGTGLGPAGSNLRRALPFWALPALDLLYSASYVILGLSVTLVRPTRWK